MVKGKTDPIVLGLLQLRFPFQLMMEPVCTLHMHMRRRPILLLNVFFLKWASLFWSFRQLLSIWTQIKLKRLHFNQSKRKVFAFQQLVQHPFKWMGRKTVWIEWNSWKMKIKFLCLALISLNIVAREALSLYWSAWLNKSL